MKSIDRYLCCECAKTLRDAQLVFKKVPNTEGQQPKCDWCHFPRFGTAYRIRYGGKR